MPAIDAFSLFFVFRSLAAITGAAVVVVHYLLSHSNRIINIVLNAFDWPNFVFWKVPNCYIESMVYPNELFTIKFITLSHSPHNNYFVIHSFKQDKPEQKSVKLSKPSFLILDIIYQWILCSVSNQYFILR